MHEKTCCSFVNARHVTLSLPLSGVIFLHAECCVENKFSSSRPPGLLWFWHEGRRNRSWPLSCGVCAAQIRWPAFSHLPSLVFVSSFTVSAW